MSQLAYFSEGGVVVGRLPTTRECIQYSIFIYEYPGVDYRFGKCLKIGFYIKITLLLLIATLLFFLVIKKLHHRRKSR